MKNELISHSVICLRETRSCKSVCFLEQALEFKHVKCGLYLIPVQVRHPVGGFADPDFIHLHRCMGGCRYKAPSLFHCAAKETSTVRVNTYQIDLTTGTIEGVVLEMVNHTQCDSDCQCVVQEHHCNNATEIYDPDRCKCKCKNLQHTCDAAIKVTLLKVKSRVFIKMFAF